MKRGWAKKLKDFCFGIFPRYGPGGHHAISYYLLVRKPWTIQAKLSTEQQRDPLFVPAEERVGRPVLCPPTCVNPERCAEDCAPYQMPQPQHNGCGLLGKLTANCLQGMDTR